MNLQGRLEKGSRCCKTRRAPASVGSSSIDALRDAPPCCPWTLKFGWAHLESAYRKYYNGRARVLDQQAVAVYLTMIASGSCLYFFIFAVLPQQHKQYHKESNTCGSLILFSWLGCGLHFAALALLPEQLYIKQRTRITLALRLLYLLGTAHGYGQCHVGRASTHEVHGTAQESLFSAGIWRSGLVGMLWYAGAFPLLLWQHCLVQAAFLLAYWASLAPAVCADITHIQLGAEAVAATERAAQLLWSQLLAAATALGSATQAAAAAAPHSPSATAGYAAVPDGGSAADSAQACLHQLRWFQFVVGCALPTFVIYCVEARSRAQWQRQWWQAARHASTVQRRQATSQQQQQHQLQCCDNSDSISPDSASTGSGSSGRCDAAEAAAAAGSWPCLFCDQPSCHRPAAGALTAAAAAAGVASSSCSTQQLEWLQCHQQYEQQGQSQGQLQQLMPELPTAAGAAAGGSCAAAAAAVGSVEVSPCSSAPSFDSDAVQAQLQAQGGSRLVCSCAGGLCCPDAFYLESQQDSLPPTQREVYVLLLALGLVWLGLGALA